MNLNSNQQLAAVSAVGSLAQIANGAFAVYQSNLMAKDVIKASRPLARARSRQALRLADKQWASYAGANIDPTRGTPVDVIAESALDEGLAVEQIGYRARLQAFELRRSGMQQLTASFANSALTFAQAAGGMKALPEKTALPTPTAKVTLEQIQKNLISPLLDPFWTPHRNLALNPYPTGIGMARP